VKTSETPRQQHALYFPGQSPSRALTGGTRSIAVALLCCLHVSAADQPAVAISGVKNDVHNQAAFHDTGAYYHRAARAQVKTVLDGLGWQWTFLDPAAETRVANSIRNASTEAEDAYPDSLSASCCQLLRGQQIPYLVIFHGYTEDKERAKGEDGLSIPSPVRDFFPAGSGADFSDPDWDPDTAQSWSRAAPYSHVRVTLTCTVIDVASNRAVYSRTDAASVAPASVSYLGSLPCIPRCSQGLRSPAFRADLQEDQE
jgi:hypothetical protein